MVKKRKKVSLEKNKQETPDSENTPVELTSFISREIKSENDIDKSDVDIEKLDGDINKSDQDIDESDVEIEKDIKENIEEKENDHVEPSSDEENSVMEDLWKSTKPMPMIETPKSRRLSLQRRSSGCLESDLETALEHLQVEKSQNTIKRIGSKSNPERSESNLWRSTSNKLKVVSYMNAGKKRGSISNLKGPNKQESMSNQFFWDDVKESNNEP